MFIFEVSKNFLISIRRKFTMKKMDYFNALLDRLQCRAPDLAVLIILVAYTSLYSQTFSSYKPISLKSSISQVQPMTGIVLWDDHEENTTSAIQLEFSYMLYNEVVKEKGVYNWESVESKLNAIASRKHQAILRFRDTYPGYQTSIPDYIKKLPGYEEIDSTSEGERTSFPDWRFAELRRFILEFYQKFAEKYDSDPRIAFIQVGFGLWAEYHIYDGPCIPGRTFPSKEFQTDFFRHLDTIFHHTYWSISIDAADETLTPFASNETLRLLKFGLFDDSFMCADHSGYNTTCWNFFDRSRYQHSPAGGEFSYYTDQDQRTVLSPDGSHGSSFENEAKKFHISYMIGSDQPSYHPMSRIRDAGISCGYKFTVSAFYSKNDSSLVTIHNKGIAPIYYDAYVTINGIRSTTSLKFLQPGDSITCNIASGGVSPVLTIECDRLVAGQVIQFNADLKGETSLVKSNSLLISNHKLPGAIYNLKGQRIHGTATTVSQLPKAGSGLYLFVPGGLPSAHSVLRMKPVFR